MHGPARVLSSPRMTERDRSCSLGRRFLAIAYDTLLLAAVLFCATALVLPLTHGEAVRSGNALYTLYLLAVSYGYFAWQWVRGGQTLGMRTWRIRLVRRTGDPPGWRDASLRFAFALGSWLALGTGFFWALFDRDGLAVHDRLSGTRLIRVKSEKSKV